MLAIGIAAHAAREGGAVGGEQRQAVSGLLDVLETFDDGADGGCAEACEGAEAVVEKELRELCVQRSEGSGWGACG